MNFYKLLLKLIGLVLFIFSWEFGLRIYPSKSSLIPTPIEVYLAFISEINAGYLVNNIFLSCYHTFLGILMGSILGILWAFAISRSTTLELLTSPMANILRPIPPIAWIPFSLVIFGSGTGAATFIVGIGVFWTTHITTLSGIKNINPNLLELAEIYNLHKPFDLFFKIILPASLPNIIGGVRTALGQGWSLIVAAELLGVPGMGQRMWEAAGVLANDIVFLYMFIIAGAYHLSDLAFTKLEGSLFKWKI